MTDMPDAELIAEVDSDLSAFAEQLERYMDQNERPQHNAYPAFNVIMDQFGGIVTENVILLDPAGLLNIKQSFFEAIMATYQMGYAGHKIAARPCTAVHPERNN